MIDYTYSVTDTKNNEVSPGDLQMQIMSSDIVLAVSHVRVEEDTDLIITFVGDIETDKTILDQVVADHSGYPPFSVDILETVMLVPNRLEVVNDLDWQALGGVVLHNEGFNVSIDELMGQVTGMIKTTGTGCKLQIKENGMSAGRNLIQPAYSQMDTQDTWVPFAAQTTLPLSQGLHSYEILAKRDGAETMWLKHTTLSLVRIY